MRLTEIKPELPPKTLAEAIVQIKKAARRLKKMNSEPTPHAKPFTSVTSL